MSDSDSSRLVIPAGTNDKFEKILSLIKDSQSMNDEERQYWINILPVMTPDQLKNLIEILENERDQLNAIDKKYAGKIKKINNEELVQKTQSDRKVMKKKRRDAEAKEDVQNSQSLENVLDKIENL
ncbi:hypothetical protein HN512_01350 [Candidatus Peregrinibacteria bacterium]|jgi:hypothetical protein|nr:hypothetical protein [Candidatus Peregrinibacteria bacterium]MBT3598462.1 hypothetical protein [Candidatus Peregrinibacteria bacterium]MBT4367123.1 hypothetical protein [Candidatus Peregrinibacteria bacterium]MBT4585992.1 hypothetical protein [Candidatus Peregrinibacteria bacterium]MBT6730869.1 hypothetical protein [Candidatus Peregrinibacteria bacterium]